MYICAVLVSAALHPVGQLQTIQAGPLTVDVRVARTATTFHLVDQLSEWSEFCHKQYARFYAASTEPLTSEDRALLSRHAALRSRRGWGSGIERAFYCADTIEAAAATAVRSGALTNLEARDEATILNHFSQRADRLTADQSAALDEFGQRIQSQRRNLSLFANSISRWFGVRSLRVPVYLLPDPDDRNGGGGFNGGRISLEIPRKYDVYPTFLHELFHAFIETKQGALQRAAQTSPGLSKETLNEGIAYALAPGIMRPNDAKQDPLLSEVRRDFASGRNLNDSYVRFHRYGLALRPILETSLADKSATFETFLPRAIDAWRVVQQLSEALIPGTSSGAATGTVFVFGPANKEILARISKQRSIFARSHAAENYAQLVPKAKPGDLVILLISLDTSDNDVPLPYRDLLPTPIGDIQARLRAGEILQVAGMARGLKTILIAAPTTAQLLAVAATSRLLGFDGV
jgi:hypothetical protein